MRHRLFALLFAAVAGGLFAAPARAQFSGDLAFTPEACKAKRACVLKNALSFVDGARRSWRAEAGDVTDGASIPDWAQAIIGGPWDESYLKAAVLHDHYCANHLASWRDTHLMFYAALVALGVSELKAKVMYYAVYVGGPRWIDVLTPEAPAPGATGEALRVTGSISREAHYETMDMSGEMKAAEDYMAVHPGSSLADLRRMAEERHPDDKFLRLGDGVVDEVAKKRGLD